MQWWNKSLEFLLAHKSLNILSILLSGFLPFQRFHGFCWSLYVMYRWKDSFEEVLCRLDLLKVNLKHRTRYDEFIETKCREKAIDDETVWWIFVWDFPGKVALKTFTENWKGPLTKEDSALSTAQLCLNDFWEIIDKRSQINSVWIYQRRY